MILYKLVYTRTLACYITPTVRPNVIISTCIHAVNYLQVNFVMAIFTDLPVELLPLVFDFVIKPYHLAQCCLVNKTFTSFAIPQLYKRIYIYAWHKDGKIKVRSFFFFFFFETYHYTMCSCRFAIYSGR